MKKILASRLFSPQQKTSTNLYLNTFALLNKTPKKKFANGRSFKSAIRYKQDNDNSQVDDVKNRRRNCGYIAEDSEYHVKCCNCESMIPIATADEHSKYCTKQTLNSIQCSFLPANEQINIEIENLKKVIKIHLSKSMNGNLWEEVLDNMEQLQTLNEYTNVVIQAISKIIFKCKMLIGNYKGSFSGLLTLNKSDVLTKEKYRIAVENYKKLYSKHINQGHVDELRKIMQSARSNFSSQYERKSLPYNMVNHLSQKQLNRSMELQNANQEEKLDDSLKKQFYYKSISIKNKLGKAHLGFWVETAPLFSYARNNQIAVSDWDRFIENELSNNATNWLDPQQIEKIKKLTEKRVKISNFPELKPIVEIRNSFSPDENK